LAHVHEFNTDNSSDSKIIDELGLNNYYCKIILRENQEDFGVFYMKKINKPYHFLINGNFEDIKDIRDMIAIFYLPKNKNDPESQRKLFTINFSPFTKI
jgi:hypothetical protein